MAAAADGDRAAIDPLFHALRPIVVAYTTRFLRDPALAEDCAHDSLVRLFGQLDRYDRERDALTWALTHATWQCRTVHRRVQRRSESSDVAKGVFDGVFDGALVAEERELVRAALATLATLAPADIEVIVAAITDDDRGALAPATFRKRLERALGRLRSSWRSRHGTL